MKKKKRITKIVAGATVVATVAVGGVLLNNQKSPGVLIEVEKGAIVEEVLPEEVLQEDIEPLEGKKQEENIKETTSQKVENKKNIETSKPEVKEKQEETSAIPEGIILKGKYTIEPIDEYKSAFSVEIPKELSADIYEIYLNGQFVDKNLLSRKIIAPPIVFSEPELLEIKLFRVQEHFATGRFTDEEIIISVKEGVLDD